MNDMRDVCDDMTGMYDDIADLYDDMTDMYAYPWHVWMLVLWCDYRLWMFEGRKYANCYVINDSKP